jgi:glycosyltransferase involved in cell wall biosynthesis
MKDRPEGYGYSNRVKFEIRKDHQIDYARAADFLNFSNNGVLVVQHEYGIFGGKWGSTLLTLLRDLNRPIVVTCHTILADADPLRHEIFQEIVTRADRVVVMTEKAMEILRDTYAVDHRKAVLIPHGIHDVPFIDPNYYKDKFGVEGRRVLLTFGLLHRNKGIEDMIEALPEIVSHHPRVTYLILGATHPNVIAEEGESYRLELQRRVRELGLDDHVLFHPRFVELDELLEYIGATDIFVAPYLNHDQITSGALAYAMGSGKAVVATPFWHAEELLADGRGRLVPFRAPDALARQVISLLDDEIELTTVRKSAYTHCRQMVWDAVAHSYVELLETVMEQAPTRTVRATSLGRPLSATNLPSPRIDHLERLTDDTGPATYARYSIPMWTYGYRLENAAVGLVAATKYYDIYKDAVAAWLAEVYLGFIDTLIELPGRISAGMSYGRKREGLATDETVGKVLWALGYVARHEHTRMADPAIDMFNDLLPHVHISSPRGAGYAVLGASDYLRRFAGASDVRRLLVKQVGSLNQLCDQPDWIDEWKDPDWALPVQALAVAGSVLDRNELRGPAQSMLEALLERSSGGTVFHDARGDGGDEENPVSAAGFIEALGALFYNSRDTSLFTHIRAAADWFLGANRVGTAVYDFSTGGCHDALTATGVNRNQGMEASAHCLLAFLTLHNLARVDVPQPEKNNVLTADILNAAPTDKHNLSTAGDSTHRPSPGAASTPERSGDSPAITTRRAPSASTKHEEPRR